MSSHFYIYTKYLLRIIYMEHEFRGPSAPLPAVCASRVLLCRIALVESFTPMQRTPIASKFCRPKAQFFIHTTRLTWALDLPLTPAAAAASAGHGLQFRHLVRRCVLSLLDGCWGQTRYAGGPTQAQLRGCLSFSWPSRPGGCALTW